VRGDHGRRLARRLGAALVLGCAAAAGQAPPATETGPAAVVPQAASAAASAPASAPARAADRRSRGVFAAAPLPLQPPVHVTGRLDAAQLGLVINDADPYSVAVGGYYAERRGLAPSQVLHVDLPVQERLAPEPFEALRARIEAHFGRGIEALALAWNEPFAVACNSITGALALGFDPDLCSRACGPSRPSPYFNSPSLRPHAELGMRLSMLLAAGSVEQAKAMIDRGVAADRSLGLRGAPPARVLLATSDDRARNVRAALYPPPGPIAPYNVEVEVLPQAELGERERVLLVQTGGAQVPNLDRLQLLPGALADHLTSFGGVLSGRRGQTTALDWIQAGATASYGNVSEPCNHLQKFPQPQMLLLHYLQGATAIEAYWRSVLWPQQGLFVGEPLAAPFASGH
jgi:uncharacterized protein (TIGR03790 family)